MRTTSITRTIAAPVRRVFDTIAHAENFRQAIPDIVKVEFVSTQKRGVGTRFKETRKMGRREATVELEVTEYVENDRVRLVSDAGGTIWDSLFTVRPVDGQTRLDFVMVAKPYRLFARLANLAFGRMIRNVIARDMDRVKACCERSGG